MDKTEAHNRLLQSIEYLKNNGKARTHEEIANRSGFARSNVSSAINGNPRYLTTGFLKRFARAYAEYINEDWLLTGEGEMVKVDTRSLRPRLPLEVAAGPMGVTIGTAMESNCEFLPIIPDMPAYDFTIPVRGDSMEPLLYDADILYCRAIDEASELREDGVYVLDSAEGAVVKRLTLTPDGLLCKSENPKYAPYIIPAAEVLRIYIVVGMSRSFSLQ